MNHLNNVREVAEIERAVGRIRDFGAVKVCEKCGLELGKEGVPQSYAWCQGRNLLDTSETRGCPFVGEHLHRICPRCKWGFLERCADYVPDPDELASDLGGE